MDVVQAYTVLSGMVERGFDIAGVSVQGTPFLIKTLTPHEVSLVRQHSFGKGAGYFRLYRMAYAIYMVNGVNYLNDRPHSIESLVEVLRDMPLESFSCIENIALKLQLRYKRYFRLIEGFTLSRRSRNIWKLRNKDPRITDEVTGIPGSRFVGISEALDAWAIVNMSLDYEEIRDDAMHSAMYVASAQNPKGVKKTAQGMETRQKMIQEERDILIKYGSIAHKDLLEGNDVKRKKQWTASLSTATDLVNELNRQMTGDKDKHDLFMEQYSLRARQRAEEAKRVADEELARVRSLRSENPSFSGSFELTAEEVKKLNSKETDLYTVAKKKFDPAKESAPGSVSTVGKRVIRPAR
jgi:hypothetical protein